MIVALLTDFGTQDHYVGTMKGVVLSVCPGAALVDITHHVPPQDITTGALELAAACPYFPAGTVFLAVVDPGVGSRRRAVAVDAGGYRFVGPDNGVLSIAAAARGIEGAVELTERRFARGAISRTFEGRDRFAPAAGWLARGTPLASFGPAVTDLVMLAVPQPSLTQEGWTGEIVRIDRFGNLITNIDESRIGAGSIVRLATRAFPLVGTYAEVPPGEACALVGSGGYVEIAVNGGSAAQVLGVTRGERVIVR